MDFIAFHKKTSKEIDNSLESYLKTWESSTNKINSSLKNLTSSFKEINKGGKKIRGVLVVLGYCLAGGQKNSDILSPAMAYEIFHSSILSHDDIIDESVLRRGRPSLYQSLGGDHHGISQAISLGDLGFFLSYKLILGCNFKDGLKIKALKFFSENLISTTIGEMLDMELPRVYKINNQSALQIALLKTAQYTVTGPLLIGAALAGASETLLSQLKNFGDNLGVAFQIQDDILGIFGSETITGKSSSQDIEEGKVSLLISHALHHAVPGDLKVLKNFYGKKEVTSKEVEVIRGLFIKLKSLDYANKEVKKRVNAANEILKKINVSREYKKILSGFSDYLLERKK